MRTFLVNFASSSGISYELVLRYTGSFIGEGFRNHDVPPNRVVELSNGWVVAANIEYESVHEFAAEYACVIDSFDSTPGN